MAVSLSQIKPADKNKAPIIAMYGVGGVGKSKFASNAPKPIFMQFEDGTGLLDFDSFGILKSYGETMEAFAALDSPDHEYKTLVLDSVDWLEPLVHSQVCRDNGFQNIEAPGYGKGYALANSYWRDIIAAAQWLRDQRGMTVIFLGHYKIKRFESPETEPYDRYQIKLNDGASNIIQEAADAVLFANYRVSTVKTEVGADKRKITRGVGGGERLIYTEERPAFFAKNRWSMPANLPLEWGAFASFVPHFNPNAAAPAPAAE